MSVGGEKPQWNFLVVAPLSDENDIFNTVFTQVSANYQDNRTTLNLGLGYRSLSQNKKTLLGINAFYDHELRYDHGRASVGIEALSTMWEMRANKYYALTDAKTGRYGNTERALHGFDVEAGIPVPYMNWATVFVKHFEWQAYGGKDDKEGQNVSLRARFPGFLTGLELEAGRSFYSDSTYSDENFISASYNLTELFKDKPSAQVPWVSSQAFKLESMEDQRFQKVRRSNVIVKQITSAFAAKVSGI
jgi:adhesin/invasin